MDYLKSRCSWITTFCGVALGIISGSLAEAKTRPGPFVAALTADECWEMGWPRECCEDDIPPPDYCCDMQPPAPTCNEDRNSNESHTNSDQQNVIGGTV